MLRLMMVLAVIAVGLVSMKSCDSAVSLKTEQTLMRKEKLQQKVQESEDIARERLQEAMDPAPPQ